MPEKGSKALLKDLRCRVQRLWDEGFDDLRMKKSSNTLLKDLG